MASVFVAIAATTSLIASVRAHAAGEVLAYLGLAALLLALCLGLACVVATITALVRHEGYAALSALVFLALTMVVLYLAPAVGIWAAALPG